MTITLNDLTDLVALSMGEFPEWKGTPGLRIIENLALSEFIRPLAEPLARQATLNLPINSCNDVSDLSPTIIQSTDWGDEHLFACELPSDFLRLHSLWMPDWPAPLSEEEAGDQLRRTLGLQAPQWLLKRTRRPMIRIVPANDCSPAQLWFGPTKARRPLQSAYIAAPRFDHASDTLLNLQPEALIPLAEALAAKIMTKFNQ